MTSSAPPEPNVIIRPLDLERDAEGLARMWNESDLAWPGTWTDGVPVTAEMVRERERSQRMLVVYVAEVDGEIVGYCSFEEGEDGHPKGEGYLHLLNVNPRYHGHSIGRRLIQATIERSVREGWKRQTLGTWSANFKAVPAYKKTGHFWTPDSSVWMQNFVPGALQMSVAKPFFARHDWYRSYVREIKQEWDDERWEGLKVFTEHWEADGESLTIRIDREARAPVAVETDRLAVAAIVGDIEPLAGSEVPITWRLTNRASEPLVVYLHATGDKGQTIDHRDAFSVQPGQTVERTATVKIDAEAPAKKDDDTAPAVRSLFRLNDDDLELFSGMRPRPPLRMNSAPGEITVCPGRPRMISLELHSGLPDATTVAVRLTPPDGLALDWTHRQVEIPAEGHVSLPLTVTAREERIYALPVRAERPALAVTGARPLSQTLQVFSLAPGGLLTLHEGGSVRVECDTARLTVEAKGATARVTHKGLDTRMLSLKPRLGPPFYPYEFVDQEFALAVEQRGPRSVLHLSAEAPHYPGLVLHEEIALSAGGQGTLTLYLENHGNEVRLLNLGLAAGTGDRDALTVVVPLHEGVVRTPNGQYPAADQDAPRDPSAYAEPWFAWEKRGAVGGVSWGDQVRVVDLAWHPRLDAAPLRAAPGERSAPVQYGFFVGSGDWQTARRALLGDHAPTTAPRLRRPLEARVEPAVLATVRDTATARLIVDSLSRRVEQGHVELALGGGATVEPARREVTRLTRGESTACDVAISLPAGLRGRASGQVTLHGTLWEETSPFEVLRLGSPRVVSVEREVRSEQDVWRIDNGAASLVVAPGFGPSIVAWEVDGQNQLYSAFPKPTGMSWMYPHFGGVYPHLVPSDTWGWEGYLFREQVACEAVYPQAGQGLPWTGVRLGATPQTKNLQGMRTEVDVLTVGDSPVVKVIYRLRNLRPVVLGCTIGLSVDPALGASPKELVACGEGIRRRPTPWAGAAMRQRWAAVTNEATGRTMLLVGQTANVALLDYGQSGRLLGAQEQVRLAGDEVREYVYYLVLADDPEHARDYLGLARLQ